LEQKEVVIGVPGGRNITPILNYLIKEKLPWEKIHIFMVDERLVPIDNEESNFRLIKEILNHFIPKENLHPFIYDSESSYFGIKSYEDEINKYGGDFDIVLVSAGEDGHIASLYPNHPSISDNSEHYIFVDNSPKPPLRRMSASKNMILRSKIGIVLFYGEIKREAYLNFLNKELDYTNCPAKLLSELSESYVITNLESGEKKK
jgi:6-phosphogluconolactonase